MNTFEDRMSTLNTHLRGLQLESARLTRIINILPVQANLKASMLMAIITTVFTVVTFLPPLRVSAYLVAVIAGICLAFVFFAWQLSMEFYVVANGVAILFNAVLIRNMDKQNFWAFVAVIAGVVLVTWIFVLIYYFKLDKAVKDITALS